MTYVDCMLAAVPADKKQAYTEHAARAATMFRRLGALSVVDCWADSVPDGKLTSFPLAVKKQEGEEVALGWVRWESKAARDAGWARFESEPALMEELGEMPFDGKRLIYGGFAIINEA